MTSEELAKRIKDFILQVLLIVRKLPQTEQNKMFCKQLIRSVSSIGANYSEAIYAHTKLDFLHIVNICRKETNETLFWLDLL